MSDDSIININTVDAMIQLSKEVMISSSKCTICALIGSSRFVDTNDDVSEETIVNLRDVGFGGLKLNNVRALVVHNQKAPLLLGQTVLGRLGQLR